MRLQTDNRVISPVEVEKDVIIYSMSPVSVGGDGNPRYTSHDIYLLRTGSEPIRLTHFEFFQLDSLNVADDKIIFQAFGPTRNTGAFPPRDNSAPAQSEIYALEFSKGEQRIRAPDRTLKPMFLMNGLSLKPAVSRDGTRAVFLHTEFGKGRYRYNMAVATIAGNLLRYVDLEGIAFSPGAFVGETLLFNELFADHYSVKRLDLSRGTVESIHILEHSPVHLEALQRIDLCPAAIQSLSKGGSDK